MDKQFFYVKDLQKNNGLVNVDFVCFEDHNVSEVPTKNATGDVHDNHWDKDKMDKVGINAPTQNRKGFRKCSLLD